MMHLYMFWTLLIGSCLYAVWRGGAPERIVGAALLMAAVASVLVPLELQARFFEVDLGLLIVDALLLVVLVVVALRADRLWPLFLAGLQLDTVGAHLFKMAEPDMIRIAYALMITGWSYPMVFALAIGTRRHQQRLKKQGFDPSWTLRGEPEAIAT